MKEFLERKKKKDVADLLCSMIQYHPQGLETFDREGYLPVHYACMAGHSLRTIKECLPQPSYVHSAADCLLQEAILPCTRDGIPMSFLPAKIFQRTRPKRLTLIFELLLLSLEVLNHHSRFIARHSEESNVKRKRKGESAAALFQSGNGQKAMEFQE